MKQWKRVAALSVLVLLAALAPPAVAKKGEPERVKVQHILIGFKRSVRGKTIDRTRLQAKRLASQLLIRAEEGEDFNALVTEYTDDKAPGVYLVTNTDVRPVAGGMKRDSENPRPRSRRKTMLKSDQIHAQKL